MLYFCSPLVSFILTLESKNHFHVFILLRVIVLLVILKKKIFVFVVFHKKKICIKTCSSS